MTSGLFQRHSMFELLPVAPPRLKRKPNIQQAVTVLQNKNLESSQPSVSNDLGSIPDLTVLPRGLHSGGSSNHHYTNDIGYNVNKPLTMNKTVNVHQSEQATSLDVILPGIEVSDASIRANDVKLSRQLSNFSAEEAISSLPPPIPWRKGGDHSNEHTSGGQKRRVGVYQCRDMGVGVNQYDSALSSFEEQLTEPREQLCDQYTTSYESQGETDSPVPYSSPRHRSYPIVRGTNCETNPLPYGTSSVDHRTQGNVAKKKQYLKSKEDSCSSEFNTSIATRISKSTSSSFLLTPDTKDHIKTKPTVLFHKPRDFGIVRPASVFSFFDDVKNKEACRQTPICEHSILCRSDAFDELVHPDAPNDPSVYDAVDESRPSDEMLSQTQQHLYYTHPHNGLSINGIVNSIIPTVSVYCDSLESSADETSNKALNRKGMPFEYSPGSDVSSAFSPFGGQPNLRYTKNSTGVTNALGTNELHSLHRTASDVETKSLTCPFINVHSAEESESMVDINRNSICQVKKKSEEKLAWKGQRSKSFDMTGHTRFETLKTSNPVSSYDESSSTEEDFRRSDSARTAARGRNFKNQSIHDDQRVQKRIKRVHKRYSEPRSNSATRRIESLADKQRSVTRSKSDMTAITHRRSRRKKLFVLNDVRDVILNKNNDDVTTDAELGVQTQITHNQVLDLTEASDNTLIAETDNVEGPSNALQKKGRAATQRVTVKDRPWHKELAVEYCHVSSQCKIDSKQPSGERKGTMTVQKYGSCVESDQVRIKPNASRLPTDQNWRRHSMLEINKSDKEYLTVKPPLLKYVTSSTKTTQRKNFLGEHDEIPIKNSTDKQQSFDGSMSLLLGGSIQSISPASSLYADKQNAKQLMSRNKTLVQKPEFVIPETASSCHIADSKILVSVKDERAVRNPSIQLSSATTCLTITSFDSCPVPDVSRTYRTNWLGDENVRYPSAADIDRRSSLRQTTDMHSADKKISNVKSETNTTVLTQSAVEDTQSSAGFTKLKSNAENQGGFTFDRKILPETELAIENKTSSLQRSVESRSQRSVDSNEKRAVVIRSSDARRRHSLHQPNIFGGVDLKVNVQRIDSGCSTTSSASVVYSVPPAGGGTVSRTVSSNKPYPQERSTRTGGLKNVDQAAVMTPSGGLIETKECPLKNFVTKPGPGGITLDSKVPPKPGRLIPCNPVFERPQHKDSNEQFKTFSLDRKSSLKNISNGWLKPSLTQTGSITTPLRPTVEETTTVLPASSTTRKTSGPELTVVTHQTLTTDNVPNVGLSNVVNKTQDFGWSVAKTRSNFIKNN